jgi:hypothetical protein
MWHWRGIFSPHFVWVWGLGLTQAYVPGFLLFGPRDIRILGVGPSGTLLKEQGFYNQVQNVGHKGPVLRPRWVGSGGARTPFVLCSILLQIFAVSCKSCLQFVFQLIMCVWTSVKLGLFLYGGDKIAIIIASSSIGCVPIDSYLSPQNDCLVLLGAFKF